MENNTRYLSENKERPETKSTTETSKSVKSVKSSRKKIDISPTTILSSIEREVNDLIQEISIRSHKNKLLSITESLKLLSKKILMGNFNINDSTIQNRESPRNQAFISKNTIGNINERSNSFFVEENCQLKDELDTLKKTADAEVHKLKEEVNDLQKKLSNNSIVIESDTKVIKKDEITAKLNQRIEQINSLYTEEKIKNNQLVLQTRNLEEALKILNLEYNNLSITFGKTQGELENLEKIITDMRKNNGENKYKFEELMKINIDLKNRIIESDNTSKLHMEDLKSLLKKNSTQQKQIEDLESKNKQLYAEVSYKHERLKAVRFMNSKLENYSKMILKKWDAVRQFETKSNEINLNSQRMLEVIEDLNEKLNKEITEKENYKNDLNIVTSEKNKILVEYGDLKKQVVLLKTINEEISSKNTEFENKFRYNISKDRAINKTFNTTTMNSLTNINNHKQDNYYSQKYAVNTNNNINEVSIEDLKPAKIMIKDNNIEIQNR